MLTHPHPDAPFEPELHLSRSCDIAAGCHIHAIRNQLKWVKSTSQPSFETIEGGCAHAEADSSTAHIYAAPVLDRVPQFGERYHGTNAAAVTMSRHGAAHRAAAVLGQAKFGISQTGLILARDNRDTTPHPYIPTDPYAEGQRARAAGLTEPNPYVLWPCVAAEWAAGFWGVGRGIVPAGN